MAWINKPTSVRRPTKSKYMYQKIYQDKRWKTIRDRRFIENPVCQQCAENGMTAPTEEIHHIIRFSDSSDEREMQILAYTYTNTRSLCIMHHKYTHAHYKIDYELRQQLLGY